MFGSRNGSARARRRGRRKAFTSSAQANPLRRSSSTMQGSAQISLHVILFASAHGGAMIQCLSKFVRERFGVEGSVHLGVVVEVNIHVAFASGGFSRNERCV